MWQEAVRKKERGALGLLKEQTEESVTGISQILNAWCHMKVSTVSVWVHHAKGAALHE